jgi:hypothetical protein
MLLYSSGWFPHSLLTLRLFSYVAGLSIGCLLVGSLVSADQISPSGGGAQREALTGTHSLSQTLQDNAPLLALEQNESLADERWTRVEFARWMVDPIVVAQPLNEQAGAPFVIGIRNINTTGFEVKVRHCNQEDKRQPEPFSYYVLERDQYLLADNTSVEAKQRFLWGKCEV